MKAATNAPSRWFLSPCGRKSRLVSDQATLLPCPRPRERAAARSAPPHSPAAHRAARTPSPYPASRPRGRVILKMSVQIPDGRKGTIHVFPGDDPKDLATNFCTKYELTDPKLQRLVERHITDSMKNLPQASERPSRGIHMTPGSAHDAPHDAPPCTRRPSHGHPASCARPAHPAPTLRQNSSRKSRRAEDSPQPPDSAPGASAPGAGSAAAGETPPPPPPAEPSEPPPNSPPHSYRPAPPTEPPPPQESPSVGADDGAGDSGRRLSHVGDSGEYPPGYLSASRLWEAGRDQGGDQSGDHGGDHDASPPLTPPQPLPPAGAPSQPRTSQPVVRPRSGYVAEVGVAAAAAETRAPPPEAAEAARHLADSEARAAAAESRAAAAEARAAPSPPTPTPPPPPTPTPTSTLTPTLAGAAARDGARAERAARSQLEDRHARLLAGTYLLWRY